MQCSSTPTFPSQIPLYLPSAILDARLLNSGHGLCFEVCIEAPLLWHESRLQLPGHGIDDTAVGGAL